MKSVAIILCVLIAVNVVYGTEDARVYRQHYRTCAQQLRVPPDELRVDTVICAAIRDGQILDPNGAYNVDLCIRKIHLLITDPINLEKAYEIFNRCHKKAVEKGAVGIDLTMQFLICGLDLIGLFDKE